MSHEAVDVADKLAHAAEATAADRLLGDQSKPARHLIKPAGVSGRVVNVEARMARNPGRDPGMFVGGVVVGDQVDLQSRGHVAVEMAEKADELLMPVTRFAGSSGTGGPPDRRQLRHPQTSQGQGVARASSALPDSLYSHLRQLAQSGGALVRTDHPAGDPPRFFPQRELIRNIDSFMTHYKASSRSFLWTATADSILDKLYRLTKVSNGAQH